MILRKDVDMRLIKKYTHESFHKSKDPVILERTAARGIVLDGDKILMLFTKRYNDYSFPGGGVDEGEEVHHGLIRELQEETGAKNIKILNHFGSYEETRPTHYKDIDFVHMISHFYVCSADRELGAASPEQYEIDNGSEPVWIDIREAIKHNRNLMKSNDKSMGLSVMRETCVLELILSEIIAKS